MIKNMGWGYLFGLMEGSMKEAGSMGNRKEEGFIPLLWGLESLSGKKAGGLNFYSV